MKRLLVLWLLALAAARLSAAELYAPPAPEWAAAVRPELGGSALPLCVNAPDQALAPVVVVLQRDLGLSPAQFAALSPVDKNGALSLAAEEARAQVSQRANELAAEARPLVWAKGGLGHADAVKLYETASGLRELSAHYGSYLPKEEREALRMSATQAAARWVEVRAALVGEKLEGTATALGSDGTAARGAAAAPAASARALVERMKATKSGWGEKDIETVLVGYGFTYRNGAKHRVYQHPEYSDLRSVVSRQKDLPPGYASEAVRLAAQVESRRAGVSEVHVAAADIEAIPVLPPPPPPPAAPAAESQASKPQRIAASKPPKAVAPIAAISAELSPTEPAPAPAPALEPAPAPQMAAVPSPATEAESVGHKNGLSDRLGRLARRLGMRP